MIPKPGDWLVVGALAAVCVILIVGATHPEVGLYAVAILMALWLLSMKDDGA